MPGMNGFELSREVLKLYPDLPVQLMSGYTASLNSDDVDDELVKQILRKPFDEAAMLRSLRKLLDA